MKTLPAPTGSRATRASRDERKARILRVCPNIEPIFRRLAERRHIPGVAYGVIVDGELIFTHSFGVGDVEARTAVDADTVFRIASMTKSFAALAIIKLRDEVKVQLDEPARTYVPELARLRYPTADSAPISVRQLLTMSAGLPQDDPWADRQLSVDDGELSRIFRRGASFSNPPGVVWEYSNYAYFALGRIIANVSGLSALDYITREVLRPLGMNATTWQPAGVPAGRQARGYRWEDERWKREEPLPSGGDVAAFAGLSSSVRDLARWVALFQSAWPPRGGREKGPVRRSSLREMQQTWRATPPVISERELGSAPLVNADGYGFGLSIDHNGRYESVGHGGGLPGFGSHMRWLPAYGIGIVALANVTYAGVHPAAAEALDDLVRAAEASPLPAQPQRALLRARDGVIQLLAAWDDRLADRIFADNFFLDSDRLHWQRRLDEVQRAHGAMRPDGPLEAYTSLRGRWRMAGKRGWCRVFITLAPTVPPRVQHLEITSTLPPSPAMRAAAALLAALVTRPPRRLAQRLFSRDANRELLLERVRVAHVLCGPCTPGEVIAGDGRALATFRFNGEKASADARLSLDLSTGKLLDAVFVRQPV